MFKLIIRVQELNFLITNLKNIEIKYVQRRKYFIIVFFNFVYICLINLLNIINSGKIIPLN